eukprot:scaffold5726_cov72-Phaeocystis_antarctica.AAC.5
MEAPWASLPGGWVYEDDGGSSAGGVYRAAHEATPPIASTRQRPTESVAALLRQREAGKGSLARAEAERSERQARAAERDAPPTLTPEAAAAKAADAVSAEAEASAARAARAVTDAAALKKATLQRVAAAAEAEAKAHAKTSVAGRLKGVAALLAELELDKYAEAFAAAGYDDTRLRAVAEEVDEDREGEGTAAVEALIAATGVKGGSAVKLRRRLLDPKAAAAGKPAGGKAKGGRGGGRGEGSGATGGGGGGGKGKGRGGGQAKK